MIYIWRILDTFFRFDAWYHYLHVSRIADDIFYGNVKGAMWQIGSSLQSTTSVCGSEPLSVGRLMGLVVKLYGDQKAQRHLPSSVHTGVMAEKTLGYQRNHKGWMISSIDIIHFGLNSFHFFVRGFLRLRTRNKNCLTRPFWLSDLGKDWSWTAFTSWSHNESHKPLLKHLWQVDRYIYRTCICTVP